MIKTTFSTQETHHHLKPKSFKNHIIYSEKKIMKTCEEMVVTSKSLNLPYYFSLYYTKCIIK